MLRPLFQQYLTHLNKSKLYARNSLRIDGAVPPDSIAAVPRGTISRRTIGWETPNVL